MAYVFFEGVGMKELHSVELSGDILLNDLLLAIENSKTLTRFADEKDLGDPLYADVQDLDSNRLGELLEHWQGGVFVDAQDYHKAPEMIASIELLIHNIPQMRMVRAIMRNLMEELLS